MRNNSVIPAKEVFCSVQDNRSILSPEADGAKPGEEGKWILHIHCAFAPLREILLPPALFGQRGRVEIAGDGHKTAFAQAAKPCALPLGELPSVTLNQRDGF